MRDVPFTRKSTCGGLCMLNGHVVKTWCATQSIIALSSGEAEYYGLVGGAANGMGIRNLAADASVAKSIASRRGCGRVRHIE